MTSKKRRWGWQWLTMGMPEDQNQAQLPMPATRGQVALDIFESAGYLVVKAALAGVKMEDIDIEVLGNILTIRGKRSNHDDVPPGQYYLQECYWGEFARSVTLPFTVNPSKLRATFSRDGILKILILREHQVKIVKIAEAA
jgi:HSP20 family protein